jgi:hypothetical protein
MGGDSGTLVQPSCCRVGVGWDDRHELVLGLLAHPSLPPQMDPVQKAVLSHTFGGPLLKTKRPVISCNVCQIRFNSQVRSPTTHPVGETGKSGDLEEGQRLGALGEGQELRECWGRAGRVRGLWKALERDVQLLCVLT